jgi:hypothetical protein
MFFKILQTGTIMNKIYLHCLLVGRQTGHRISGKPFVGCWLLLVPQMMLVPAVLQADWDLLQDHSQAVEKHWEVPAAVSLQKQLMFGADLQIVIS